MRATRPPIRFHGTILVAALSVALAGCDISLGPITGGGGGLWDEDWEFGAPINPTPLAVAGGHAFAIADAGWGHTCAVDRAGAAWCWGEGGMGQLGAPEDYSQPAWGGAPVAVLGGLTFTEVEVALSVSCGISDQRLLCWGSSAELPFAGDTPAEPWPGTELVSAAPGGAIFSGTDGSGGAHLCALGADARVYCSGSNYFGQLGRDTVAPYDWTLAAAGDLTGVVHVTTGWLHSCALLDTGEAWCWGGDESGELGDGAETPDRCTWAGLIMPCRTTPERVATTLRFHTLSAGVGVTCGLEEAGRLFCWGRSAVDGQRIEEPVEVDPAAFAGRAVVAVSVGGSHACALDDEGDAFCWGRNDFGQLGTGNTTEHPTPAAVAGGHRFRAISAGDTHTCAITVDDAAYCWGNGLQGRLGNG